MLVNFFHQIRSKLHSLFGRNKQRKVYYKKTHFVGITPKNDKIQRKRFYIVIYEGEPYWALFKCPCGCNTVISLPMTKDKYPNWTIEVSKNNRPTLFPSVWQNKGCKSHFWVKNGLVVWCSDTGTSPKNIEV